MLRSTWIAIIEGHLERDIGLRGPTAPGIDHIGTDHLHMDALLHAVDDLLLWDDVTHIGEQVILFHDIPQIRRGHDPMTDHLYPLVRKAGNGGLHQLLGDLLLLDEDRGFRAIYRRQGKGQAKRYGENDGKGEPEGLAPSADDVQVVLETRFGLFDVVWLTLVGNRCVHSVVFSDLLCSDRIDKRPFTAVRRGLPPTPGGYCIQYRLICTGRYSSPTVTALASAVLLLTSYFWREYR